MSRRRQAPAGGRRARGVNRGAEVSALEVGGLGQSHGRQPDQRVPLCPSLGGDGDSERVSIQRRISLYSRCSLFHGLRARGTHAAEAQRAKGKAQSWGVEEE